MQVTALGADGENAQSVSTEKCERGDAFQKGDVVLDAHSLDINASLIFSKNPYRGSGSYGISL